MSEYIVATTPYVQPFALQVRMVQVRSRTESLGNLVFTTLRGLSLVCPFRRSCCSKRPLVPACGLCVHGWMAPVPSRWSTSTSTSKLVWERPRKWSSRGWTILKTTRASLKLSTSLLSGIGRQFSFSRLLQVADQDLVGRAPSTGQSVRQLQNQRPAAFSSQRHVQSHREGQPGPARAVQ